MNNQFNIEGFFNKFENYLNENMLNLSSTDFLISSMKNNVCHACGEGTVEHALCKFPHSDNYYVLSSYSACLSDDEELKHEIIEAEFDSEPNDYFNRYYVLNN